MVEYMDVEIITCTFQNGKGECQIVRKFGKDQFKTETIKNLEGVNINTTPRTSKCNFNPEFNHLQCEDE